MRGAAGFGMIVKSLDGCERTPPMIQPASPQIAFGFGRAAAGLAAARLVAVVVEPAALAAAPRPAPRPDPRRVAGGLQALACDGVPAPGGSPARAAFVAFTAGDGFVPGQLIDRAI